VSHAEGHLEALVLRERVDPDLDGTVRAEVARRERGETDRDAIAGGGIEGGDDGDEPAPGDEAREIRTEAEEHEAENERGDLQHPSHPRVP
jgi:hypothetical protein